MKDWTTENDAPPGRAGIHGLLQMWAPTDPGRIRPDGSEGIPERTGDGVNLDNICWTCQALAAPPHPPFSEDIMAGLRSDHQFAQHARHMDLFHMGDAKSEEGLAKAMDISEQTNFGESPVTRILEEAHQRKEDDEYATARTGLEVAMAKVERGIDPEFRRFGRVKLVEIAKYQPFLTSDDIWAKMPKPYDLAHYREARHMSDIVKWGVRQGYIERNNRYVSSKSPKANMVPHNQWRSMLFGRVDRW